MTSSSPHRGRRVHGRRRRPAHIDRVLGIAKAYITRVGSGPFPTELFDETGELLQKVGGEWGTTTGRQRRCGWYDGVIARYAVQVNGLTDLVITKLDVLSAVDTIKVCVAYEYEGKRYNNLPCHQTAFHHAKPIYEELPGWGVDITDCRTFDELPKEARDYIGFIEDLAECPGLDDRRRSEPRADDHFAAGNRGRSGTDPGSHSLPHDGARRGYNNSRRHRTDVISRGESVSNELKKAVDPRRNFGHALPGGTLVGRHRRGHPRLRFCSRASGWSSRPSSSTYFIGAHDRDHRSSRSSASARSGEAKQRDWTDGEDEVGEFGFAPSDVRHVVDRPDLQGAGRDHQPDAGRARRPAPSGRARHRGARHGGARA